MKDRTRELATKVATEATVDEEQRFLDWNLRWDGDPPEMVDLWRKWDDFIPGYVERDRRNGTSWIVEDVSLKQIGMSTGLYMVSVEWIRLDIEDPLKIPFRWTGCEAASIEVPAWVDENGKMIQTTAGEPIVGMNRKLTIWKLTGTKNVPGFPNWMTTHGESVNSDSVRVGSISVPPEQLSLQGLSLGDIDDSTRIGKKRILYRPMEVEVWWNPFYWREYVLNQGFYELSKQTVTNSKGKEVEVDSLVRCQQNGQDAQKPCLLDREGRRPRDKDGNVKAVLSPGDVVVLDFQLNKKLPYRQLLR